MNLEVSKLDDQQKELCAILVMRTMLEDYSKDTGVSYEEAFYRFVKSPAYEDLFDYSTGLWREGPDYLRARFLERSWKKGLAVKPVFFCKKSGHFRY